MKFSRHYILLAVLIVLGGYAAWVFSDSVTPYVSIKTATAAKKNVQVKGVLDVDAPSPKQSGNEFVFQLTDDEGSKMLVKYQGTKPEQFDEAHHIVAVGKFDGDAFKAHQLLLKCPSKYEKEKTS